MFFDLSFFLCIFERNLQEACRVFLAVRNFMAYLPSVF